ncbi:MAG: rhodanese-like domain-containing protein [Actinomycetota bacterium]|nr:rhodanese-like domain-containing protein [Actinomycetota bacterium]
MPHTTVDEMLARARSRLDRMTPAQAAAAVRDGARLIDIRQEAQRADDGVVPDASFVHRNVLEWRLDPSSGAPDPAVADLDAQVIVLCHEGYASSLAAATLQGLGYGRATDVIGGFQAWKAAGLPVTPA